MSERLENQRHRDVSRGTTAAGVPSAVRAESAPLGRAETRSFLRLTSLSRHDATHLGVLVDERVVDTDGERESDQHLPPDRHEPDGDQEADEQQSRRVREPRKFGNGSEL